MKQQSERLLLILKNLSLKWEMTKALWNDPVGNDFEKQAILPFLDEIRLTQQKIDQLAQVIEQMHRDIQ